ncbi:Hypothetical predicted protein [Lecanosticta acicola]|uniref:CCZ1/INTU/HSP4 first Longin domain-containing protein n=1 Tax=Lecanosticta acicola TaxID=111012 RepID=A0AAI9ECV0_9PEZI|nr:Hypothetical predicted protein [Lecanosticta acicola]
MTSSQWHNTVVPARLAYLAIYNPSLGLTDETFPDQLVFYYSRAAHEARTAAKKNARDDAAGGDAIRAGENEKLRNIGLAQGMVDFARSFSKGQPVDSIDTEKSRIVLHELEEGWWILASIDLTRLPGAAIASPDPAKTGGEKGEPKQSIEYSSREVSPPTLLLQQLVQAHHIFTLHHGPSLTEQFVRLPRDKFCNALDRYWSRFARAWYVLLHGNPATDVFGGLKLSSGGELGMGVGEEEWGSGERDVLEDLTRRTDGLVDLVVSRFGEPAPTDDESVMTESEALPWLGSGSHPLASDGVIFGGINAITRPSLRNVSLWMRNIYTYGEYAYGVRDNPHRERRKRRRRNPIPEPDPEPEPAQNGSPERSKGTREVSAGDYKRRVEKKGEQQGRQTVQGLETQSAGKSASDAPDEMRGPGIPPPIVTAVQQSLDDATKKAEKADQEGSQSRQTSEEDLGTTLGIPDQYMKYLTFGLSTLAKPSAPKRPENLQRKSEASSMTIRGQQTDAISRLKVQEEVADTDDDGPALAQMDPVPDGQTLHDKIAKQKRQEEKGQFVVGLKGDLDSIPDDPDASVEVVDEGSWGLRNIFRTLQIEVIPSPTKEEDRTDLQKKLDEAGLQSGTNDPLNFKRLRVLVYVHRPFMYCFLFENRTPSLSLARFYKDLHSNLAPIQKPLLASTSVERIAQRIADAQEPATTTTTPDDASVLTGNKSKKPAEPKPIYDLIFDPALLTVHTSIPNIPEPGTPAAEGFVANKKDPRIPHAPDWTRIEALNVHSQILNTLVSTQRNLHEYERTSKTSRGWWVVWMKLSPSISRETATKQDAEAQQDTAKQPGMEEDADQIGQGDSVSTVPLEAQESDSTLQASKSREWFESTATTKKEELSMNRIAVLVRKATDAANPAKASTTSRAVSSMWQSLSLRSTSTSDDRTGGADAGWGPAALAGGIGFDPRKYVEGLLQLSR